MKRCLEKKLYHIRRSLLPEVLSLNCRKLLFAARLLSRGRVAVPVFRSSSPNMTFVLPSRAGRRKLYAIDTDPDLFARAYALFEGGILPRRFPADAPYVCAEWVAGRPLTAAPDAEQARVLAALLAQIHSRRPENCPVRFAHLDRLNRRFDENTRALPADGAARAMALRDRIRRAYDRVAASLPLACVHPDMIAGNVVLRDGAPVVFDNEFLSAGAGKEFDVINSMYSLAPEVREAFLAAYGREAPLEHFHRYRELWEDLHTFKRLSRAMRFRNRRRIDELLPAAP